MTMNYCDEHKLLWLAPVRTASRTVGLVLRHLGFVEGATGRDLRSAPHTHAPEIPAGKENYRLLCTVRNPFFRMPSIYAWAKAQTPFHEWVETATQPWVLYERALHGREFQTIRTEHLEDDLLAIDAVRAVAAQPAVQADFTRFVRDNPFRAVANAAEFYRDERAADAVRRVCSEQFAMFGYSMEAPR